MPLKLPSFRARSDVYPPDLWTKCPTCSTMLFNKQLDKHLRVCTTCGHHFRLSASARLDHLARRRHVGRARRRPPVGRCPRLRRPEDLPGPARRGPAGDRDARRGDVGHRRIEGRAVALCVMDFGFMGGSMGAVVGEKVTRAAEHALDGARPAHRRRASGGARMQEGTLALMQLAKTMAALERLRAGGVPFLSVLSDPTTGGVFASFAAVGDVNIAEPDALIGFAGARVVGRDDRRRAAARLPALRVPVRATASSTGSSSRATCATSSVRWLRLLPARGAAAPIVERPRTCPAFRPLSFLSTIADRVGDAGHRRRRRAERGGSAARRRLVRR